MPSETLSILASGGCAESLIERLEEFQVLLKGMHCSKCSELVVPGLVLTCPRCEGPLDFDYDLEHGRKTLDRDEIAARHGNMWNRWSDLLPLANPAKAVSLGEGSTPLINSPRLAAALGLSNLWLKLEFCNPTGSFKDRQISAGMSAAIERGAREFAIVSSGNAGVSAATYATRAGLPVWVWIGPDTPQAKVDQILVAGARVLQFEEPAPYRAVYRRLGAECQRWGMIPLITARRVNPYVTEGGKTVLYEIAHQLGWRSPDWLAVPVGGGGLLGGCWTALRELSTLGWIEGRPRLLAGQFGEALSILEAAEGRTEEGRFEGLDAHWAGTAVRESSGEAVLLSRAEIAGAQAELAATEGIYVEPQGAMGLAALIVACHERRVPKGAKAVAVLTGHGLKDREGSTRLATMRARENLQRIGGLADPRRSGSEEP